MGQYRVGLGEGIPICGRCVEDNQRNLEANDELLAKWNAEERNGDEAGGAKNLGQEAPRCSAGASEKGGQCYPTGGASSRGEQGIKKKDDTRLLRYVVP